MVTATAELAPPLENHLVLDGMSWDFYESLLAEIGNRPIRVTFDHGRMEITSPLPEHEGWSRSIGRFVEVYTEELDIPIRSLGSSTFRRREIERGVEPDECYYIEHEAQVRGKKRLDLGVEPPPDLVIEIDITHLDIEREPIYASMGVPELWRFDGQKLRVLRLARRKYEPVENSLALPQLRVADLERFLAMLATADETTVMRSFRKWVKESFAGR